LLKNNDYVEISFPEKSSYRSSGNLLATAITSASSSIENYGWGLTKVNNGSKVGSDLGWTSNSYTDDGNHTEWVTFDLGTTMPVKKMIMYPRSDSGNAGKGFPVDFTVDVSDDGLSWTTVASHTNYANPGSTPQSLVFPSQQARYVRIHVTKLGPNGSGYWQFQLSEVELFTSVNLALSATPSASSSIENYGWGLSKLNNGVTAGSDLGWTSNSYTDNGNHNEWVKLDLGSSTPINKVVMYPRSDSGNEGKGFPVHFTVDVSNDGSSWSSVVAQTNYANPFSTPQVFSFSSQNARYVRVNATGLGPNGPGYWQFQLSELEVY